MAYGLKYQTQFSSIADDFNPSRLYTLQFLFKGYTGGPMTITGAGVTVQQKCSIDDPAEPIKGQSLDIALVNAGDIPISAFMSDDDDGVQVKLLDENNNVLFIGYLVQDDFGEVAVDYEHVINLTATDGLGLLKDVPLQDAEVRRSFYAVRRTNGVDTEIYVYVADIAFYPQPGNTIEIGGGTYAIASATPQIPLTVIDSIGYNWLIVTTTTTGGIAYGDETIYLTGEINLTERNSLLSMIAVCLAQTNLALVTNVFMNLYEYRQDNTRSCLPQTIISSQTFISGDGYQDCYSVLTKILETFNCTLFQANGQWQIINWFEAKQYTGYALPGFVFDETWAEIGTTTFSNLVNIGPGAATQHIFPLNITSYRSWKFSKKKFEYQNPKYLLKNYDLQTIGDLIREYTTGGFTYREYVAIGWENAWVLPFCERFIRVKFDSNGGEVFRELVVRSVAFDNRRAVAGTPFEVGKGDKIKFSFSFNTNISLPGPAFIVFTLELWDGTLYRYVNELPVDNGEWLPTLGFTYTIPSGDNANQWHNVEIQSSQTPFAGMCTPYLAIVTPNPANSSRETHYKDIRIEVTPFINDTSKIIGQTHKQEQTGTKKLNQSQDINIDDAPRNAISGALFLPTKTGLVQDLTTYWRYAADASGWRLGERSTLQELTWRRMTRLKYEAGFTGAWQNNTPVSLLTLARIAFNPTKIFTFGLLTIDYRRNEYNGTLWELHDELEPEFSPDYEFKYLYSTT